ncbi:MAG: hypothetical protein M1324_01995 [Patescibacteria group bacterium]|nr:hypothetical protein [Patescibacteria group bacterium]
MAQNLSIENQTFSQQLHFDVMKKIVFLKFKKDFLFFFSVLTANFLIFAWCVDHILIENEFLNSAKILLRDFEFSYSFFLNSISFIVNSVSILLLISFLFSTIIGIYLLCLIIMTKKKLKSCISSFETNAQSMTY